ncbi:hypothetical protein NEOKW01_0093 [Nematocida sp. AWRm80]|nr:hypothetical protein NEOKW01_0093 [Nematocida sp. AWRm80]
MLPSIPSTILRSILKKQDRSSIPTITNLMVYGKILRRVGDTSILFDSLCGLPIYTPSKLHDSIDKSILNSYLIKIHCKLERYPRVRIRALSTDEISFSEEMYFTLESIEFWNRILSQKQPK